MSSEQMAPTCINDCTGSPLKRRTGKTKYALLAVVVIGAVAFATACVMQGPVQGSWLAAGGDIANTRNAADETTINAANVSRLKKKWEFGGWAWFPATPTVANNVVYAPDMAGNLYALAADTGSLIWQTTISSYTGRSGDGSRNSPAIAGSLLVLGTGLQSTVLTDGAYVIGVNASDGTLAWKTLVDTHPAALITGSPVIANGVAYVGVASKEELLSGTVSSYPCCTFRGGIVAVDVATGKLLWHTFTSPDNGGQPGGYSGAAVWSGSPAIDLKRGLIYFSTGNNYSVPAGVCTMPNETGCNPVAADDYVDSIVAARLSDGHIVWSMPSSTSDAGNRSCKPQDNCGPDYDFGSSPNLFTVAIHGVPRDLVGAGNKSGNYWALDPDSGVVVWKTKVGPDGLFGGIQWGTSSDGKRVYVNITNTGNIPWTIKSATGATSTVSNGFWSALDAATGQILWQTADPQTGLDMGYMSSANGVVYAPSGAWLGNNMYALDAATGEIKWSFPSGGSVVSGAAVVGGNVFWGSGYIPGFPNNTLYAFSLDGL